KMEEKVSSLKSALHLYKIDKTVNSDLQEAIDKCNSFEIRNRSLLQLPKTVNILTVEKYIASLASQIIYVTEQDTTELKELFNQFGVPYLQAAGEAEAVAAVLCI